MGVAFFVVSLCFGGRLGDACHLSFEKGGAKELEKGNIYKGPCARMRSAQTLLYLHAGDNILPYIFEVCALE